MSSPFRENNLIGRLMMVEPDEYVKLKYTIWFDYTRNAMGLIREGDFVAVPNFTINRDHEVYSILKITNLMPTHFALGSSSADLRGYPGFLVESAKNIVASWRDQVNAPLEDTTKIVCEAMPIVLQFEDSSDCSSTKVGIEKSIGMIGEEVRLISSEMSNKIVNGNLVEGPECIPIGKLVRDEKVSVLLKVDDLLKTHFGVFGFTGVGKSNLISNLISLLLTKRETEASIDKKENIIVLFDLMDEYTGLLFDLLVDEKLDANLIYCGEKSIPGPVIDYLNKNSNEKKNTNIIRIFIRGLLLPKGLKSKSPTFVGPVEKLLNSGRIKIMVPDDFYIEEFLSNIWEEKVMKGCKSNNTKNRMWDLKEKLVKEYANQKLTKDNSELIINFALNEEKTWRKPGDKDFYGPYLNNLKVEIKRATSSEIFLRDDLKITRKKLIEKLQQKKDGLYIITSNDQDQLRYVSKEMGEQLYEERRKKGIIDPNVIFIFDEADEFIPQSPSRESQKESKKIIETLTRRGRKFGIGVGIATQRSSHLDTNIMGQLHTYFISKLPRDYDRKVVGEAFSIGESEFIQTFKFSKGQWLIISHDALGIDSVALPIKTENAEERIIRNLESIKKSDTDKKS